MEWFDWVEVSAREGGGAWPGWEWEWEWFVWDGEFVGCDSVSGLGWMGRREESTCGLPGREGGGGGGSGASKKGSADNEGGGAV